MIRWIMSRLYNTPRTCKERNGESCIKNIYNNLKSGNKCRINVIILYTLYINEYLC